MGGERSIMARSVRLALAAEGMNGKVEEGGRKGCHTHSTPTQPHSNERRHGRALIADSVDGEGK